MGNVAPFLLAPFEFDQFLDTEDNEALLLGLAKSE
jgi:hypothetical protein